MDVTMDVDMDIDLGPLPEPDVIDEFVSAGFYINFVLYKRLSPFSDDTEREKKN
jgi:hypothetical protein